MHFFVIALAFLAAPSAFAASYLTKTAVSLIGSGC